MVCAKTYKTFLSCGVSEIVVTGFVAELEYMIDIYHPNDYVHTSNYTADSFGDITIPLTQFTEQFFNPYSGYYGLRASVVGENCELVYFCDEYINIEFKIVTGNGEKNTLSCCASGENGQIMSCCTTERHIFTDEDVTTIPYSGARPQIEVAYLNPDGSFTLGSMGVTTHVTFNATEFIINHGGVSSGVIKLSR